MTDALPRPARTRHRILEAAQAVFLAQGYGAASMDAVAARAGVSKQTVYAHFGAKEALFVAMTGAMTGAAIAAAVPEPEPEADVALWLAGHAHQQLETARSWPLMQLRRIAIAEAARFPQVGAAVHAAGPARAIARLAGIIGGWHRAGRLHAPDAAQAAAVFNWLIMGGPTTEAMLLGRTEMQDPGKAGVHVRECVRVFLAAYGPRPEG